MSENRLTGKPLEEREEGRKKLADPLPIVTARRSFHWTCPECGRTQLALRSMTHEACCSACLKRYRIVILTKEPT